MNTFRLLTGALLSVLCIGAAGSACAADSNAEEALSRKSHPVEIRQHAELRGLGMIKARGRVYDGGTSAWVTFTASDARNAERCGSKLLADWLGFGDVKQVSLTPTVLKLEGAGFWRLGLDGAKAHLLFARTEAAMAGLVKRAGAERWKPVPGAAYPRWLDRFDNDAVAMGCFGWGIIPKDFYGDLDWTTRHFKRILTDVSKEHQYIAPGVFDFSMLDWWQKVAAQKGVSADFYLSEMYPERPTFTWNVVPLPHVKALPSTISCLQLWIERLAVYSQWIPIASTDQYLEACQRGFGEKAASYDNFGAHFATAELAHNFMPFLSGVAGGPEAQAAWVRYQREVLGRDLQAVGLTYKGNARAYASWKALELPTIRDFVGWGSPGCLDLREGAVWQLHTDFEHQGVAGKWFASANAEGWSRCNPNDPLLLMYSGYSKEHPEAGPELWLRRTFTVKKEELAALRYLHADTASLDMNAWINGKPLKNLTDMHPITGDLETCFEVGDGLHEGENTLVVNTYGKPLSGYIFLSSEGRWQYPSADRLRNRLFFDGVEFSAWWRLQGVVKTLRAYRAGDPDGHPQLVMAPRDFLDLLIPSLKKYGAFPHCTGQSGGCWAPWVTSYAALYGLPLSSEPGGPPRNVLGLRKMVTLYSLLGNDGVNFLFDPSSYRDANEGRLGQWVDENRELLRCVGKLDLPQVEIGVLRSVRDAGRLRLGAVWSSDVSRGDLQTTGRRGQLVDPTDVVAGNVHYPVLFDASTELLTEAEIAGLERYVRAGGTFVALHNTGQHSPEAAYCWPISKLTGLRVVNQNRSRGGRIRFSETQSLWPKLRGQEVDGWGLVYDWTGKDVTGDSLKLEPVADDVEVIAEWVGTKPGEGKIALATRKLGKGRVITLGNTFWRKGRDEGGRYTSDAGGLPYLDELLTNLGVQRASSEADPEASRQLFTEQWRSKNGLYDVYFVARVNEKEGKLECAPTFLTRAPHDGLREISAQGHPEVAAQPVENGFTLPKMELEPMQTRLFAAPRADLAQAPFHWLKSLEKRWYALEKIAKKPEIQKPSPWIIPLVQDWKMVPGGESWNVPPQHVDWAGAPSITLGLFDTLGLAPDAVAHFRREISLPDSWRGRRLSLVFYSPKNYFWGVTPNGRLWINGKPSPMNLQWQVAYNQAVDVTVPEDGKLELILEVDGRLKPGAARGRPTGVAGMFYLLSNPQPLKTQVIGGWQASLNIGESVPAQVGKKNTFRYMEARFKVPSDWPVDKLFLETSSSAGFGWLCLNDQIVEFGNATRELDVSRLLRAPGEENVLRWCPRSPSHKNTFTELLPEFRVSAWPDRPFAPGGQGKRE